MSSNSGSTLMFRFWRRKSDIKSLLQWPEHPNIRACPSSSLAYLRTRAVNSCHHPKTHCLDCPFQASLGIWRCKMAASWEKPHEQNWRHNYCQRTFSQPLRRNPTHTQLRPSRYENKTHLRRTVPSWGGLSRVALVATCPHWESDPWYWLMYRKELV